MCNINFLYSKKGRLKDNRIIPILESITAFSFKTNDEGDGFLLDDGFIAKKSQKMLYYNFKDRIKKSRWIVSHQRIATSGRNDSNTQPLRYKDFVLIHNGIIWNLGDKDNSDSKNLLKNIVDGKFNQKTFKKQIEGIDGSYSIFFFDIKRKEMYYFKNYSTDFYVCENKNYIFASTSKENAEFCRNVLNLGKIKEVKEEKVFILKDNQFKRIFDFKAKKYNYESWKDDDYKSLQTFGKPMTPSEIESLQTLNWKEESWESDLKNHNNNINIGGKWLNKAAARKYYWEEEE